MTKVVYTSKSTIERKRGPLRIAHLPGESQPVVYWRHTFATDLLSKGAPVSKSRSVSSKDPMLTGEIRNQIDRIWDAFWSGGISNPRTISQEAKVQRRRLGPGYILVMALALVFNPAHSDGQVNSAATTAGWTEDSSPWLAADVISAAFFVCVPLWLLFLTQADARTSRFFSDEPFTNRGHARDNTTRTWTYSAVT